MLGPDDPDAARRPPDVLGEDAPAGSRRPLLIGLALLLVLAGWSGVDALRDRRAAADQERRARAALELAVAAGAPQSVEYDGGTRQGVLRRPVRLRNDGPREVVVERAELDGLRLQGGPVPVPAGAEARLELEQRVSCRREPGPAEAGGPLRLQVRTGAGPRTAELLVRPDTAPDDARRSCGYLTVQEAVRLLVEPGRASRDELVLEVTATNAGVLPAKLLEVSVGSGLSSRLMTPQGEPVALPLDLPPRTSSGEAFGTRLRMTVTVQDCARVLTSERGSLQPGSIAAVGFRAEQTGTAARPAGSTLAVPRDRATLLALVDRRCPDLLD